MSDLIHRLNAALQDRYEIESELGAGGMATVYLARDVRHNRHVALKVLKPELAAVVGAKRFLAEIETTAGLQHPHILPLFDSGEADGFLYYVMPRVQGESLRARLDREKQLPVDEAVRMAASVASALDYAHRQGVVHRDIKPANILVQDGEPVVADFGIALAVGGAGGGRLTETGLSVGTPHYMSPEQAFGSHDLDRRSDLYSLAATLYETLVGEPPFVAPSTQAVVARIALEPAPWATEQRDTVPSHVSAVIQKGLAKLPADRFQTGAEFAESLLTPGGFTSTSIGGLPYPGDRRTARDSPWRIAGAVVVVALLVTALLATLLGDRGSTGITAPVAFKVRLDQRMGLVFGLSDDGSRLAFSTANGGLATRSLGDPGVVPIGSSSGRVWGQPTFSPGGDWIAFVDVERGELQRVPAQGGSPVAIASIPLLVLGLAWGPDDHIVWGNGFSGLSAVSVEGGVAVPLTTTDTVRGELGHWHPQYLPGGTKVLFTTYRTPFDSTAVELLDLESGRRSVLLRGGVHGRYAPSGHILYSRGETLWRVPFDPENGRVEGNPEPVLEGVAYDPANARGGFAISRNGTLAYMEASVWNETGELTWVDRGGVEEPLPFEPGVFSDPSISPDGRWVALVRNQQGSPDVWVYDLELGGQPTRVTRAVGLVANPIWAPGGQDLIYSRERRLLELVRRDWQSGGAEVPIPVRGDRDVYAWALTPDNRLILGTQDESWDLWTVSTTPADQPVEPVEFRVTEFHERTSVVSPDGRWVAYVSTETGPDEIWIDPYPRSDPGRRRRQVTRSGGDAPQWGRNGELFYRSGPRVMAVQIDLASGNPGIPQELFAGSYGLPGSYAVSSAHDRFLMIKPQEHESARREAVVVLNWLGGVDERP
ncbi:MAG: protein kinase [Gemmatimonadota bacterium]|nr:protein kinase [Gemmatimonadota bacterium]